MKRALDCLTTMPVFLIGWHCFLHICEPRRISGPHFSLPDRKYVFVRRLMAGRHSNNIASHFEVSNMKLLIQNIEEKFHRLYNKCEGILASQRADVSCFFRCTVFQQTTMESGVARRLLSYPLCFFSLFRTPQSVLWIELPGPWRLAERQKQLQNNKWHVFWISVWQSTCSETSEIVSKVATTAKTKVWKRGMA